MRAARCGQCRCRGANEASREKSKDSERNYLEEDFVHRREYIILSSNDSSSEDVQILKRVNRLGRTVPEK